jgi:hypothetical protein
MAMEDVCCIEEHTKLFFAKCCIETA